jgi:hypothetical protein
MSIRSLLLGVICAAWSCSDMLPVDRAMGPIRAWRVARRTDRVVVVVLDGVRWQDVFDRTAEMPTLQRWMDREGTCIGAPGYGEMRATGPNYVSLPSYNEIFSGRGPSECQTNECPRRTDLTVIDELASAGRDAAIVSSWESIEHAATPNDVVPVSAGRFRVHRPEAFDGALLEAGRVAGAGPGIGEFRQDAYTTRIALHVLEHRKPSFLFVGLGEPDEYAHRGEHEGYLASLREADRSIEALERAAGDRAAILVTTDHGRNAAFRDHGGGWPESGRVWMIAKGGAVKARGCVASDRHRLADIAPTVRLMLSLAPDTDPLAGRPFDELFE